MARVPLDGEHMVAQIIKEASSEPRIRLRCPHCSWQRDFHKKDSGYMGFFIVRHLIHKHNLERTEVLRLYPEYLDDVNDCP